MFVFLNTVMFVILLCQLLRYVNIFIHVIHIFIISYFNRFFFQVVLDLTKFITFAITCIFILLVFGVPGHNQFSPTWCYIMITVAYYFLTEPWTHENATKWLAWFQVECFENLEVLWAPVLLRLFSSFISGKHRYNLNIFLSVLETKTRGFS